jgi:hypothetical protein
VRLNKTKQHSTDAKYGNLLKRFKPGKKFAFETIEDENKRQWGSLLVCTLVYIKPFNLT